MRHISLLALAFSSLSGTSWSQDQRVSVPEPNLASSNPTTLPPTDLNRQNLDVTIVDVDLSDELPAPPDSASGKKGNGDPFFLGFVGGDYYPPIDERIDPKLIGEVQLQPTDGRPAPTSYGYVMFSKRITSARLESLRDLGVRVLGFHPHSCVKVALPPETIDAVAALDFVRWIGAPRTHQKAQPWLVDAVQAAGEGELEFVLNLYESDLCADSVRQLIARAEQADAGDDPKVTTVVDERSGAFRWQSNGWQQRALENVGFDVLEYTESHSVIAFIVRAPAAALETFVGLDFVAFVEGRPEVTLSHDESTPMINADTARYYYTGGSNSVVTAGEIDSGISYNHFDITTHLNALGWDFSGSAGGAWSDTCPHGTHVCGTFAGNGYVDPGNRGVAPGLGWGANGRFFNAKIFNGCNGGVNLANVLATFRNGAYDGGGVFTPKPMIVNNSWGSSGPAWIGSEFDARLIDDEVFWQRQFYVFAAGNDANTSTVGLQAGAKNAFAVGSVDDYHWSGFTTPGGRSSFSSQGPMGDARWKPNVCAPGDIITSTSPNSNTAYYQSGGTSMAAPHVSGVAAQMCDNHAWLRYAPPGLASILMATALTRGGTPILDHWNSQLNGYGTGRVDAWLANLSSYQTSWVNSVFDLAPGQSGSGDFFVPAGTTRVVVCTNWNEVASSAGASIAAVNDWDLYIDREPFTSASNSGEFHAGLSSRDNTEIRYLDAPATGWYRWKLHPYNAPSTGHFGVTVYFVSGALNPSIDLTLTPSSNYTKPWQAVTIDASVYNPGYLASAVWLDTAGTGGLLSNTNRYINDVGWDSVSNNVSNGSRVLLGDILSLNSRYASFTHMWLGEGVHPFSVTSWLDNGTGDGETVYVTVDGTAPSDVANVSSPSHTPGVWSCESYVTLQWSAATDALAGVAGYSVSMDQIPAFEPDGIVDITSLTTNYSLPDTSSPYYFHIRAVDRSGNIGNTAHFGPIYVNTTTNAVYCTSKINSQQCIPYMSYSGRASVNGPDNFHLSGHDVLNNKAGLLFWGLGYSSSPFQGGTKCVASPQRRTATLNSGGNPSGNDCSGVLDFHWTQAYSLSQGVVEGTWVYCQFWYRDPQDAYSAGLTDAVQFLICRD